MLKINLNSPRITITCGNSFNSILSRCGLGSSAVSDLPCRTSDYTIIHLGGLLRVAESQATVQPDIIRTSLMTEGTHTYMYRYACLGVQSKALLAALGTGG